MKRKLQDYLTTWIDVNDRKPLIIRGARQVGKTWLVRHLAEISGRQLIEINFEKQPQLASLFTSNDVQQILLNLNSMLEKEIIIEKCLLFLDEIQAVPHLLSKLRWFAEDLPGLPVIATGSLLEFVLSDHSFSMPVGRISYVHLEPMSFEEFLLANRKTSLCDYLAKYELNMEMPAAIHEKLTNIFKEYLLIGGMPAAVLSWVEEHSLNKINQIQSDLLATYRDDFAKYKGRIAIERLDEVMMAVPAMLGQKFTYSRVNKEVASATIKQVLTLLEKARLCHRVQSSAANGVPLGAEVKEKHFKEIFLDVGLCSMALGLSLQQLNSSSEVILINNGGIAEQVAGQALRTIAPPYIEPALYYWNRDEVGASAEVDYVIQQGNCVIPVEVKAGGTGSLKSLHMFMGLKKSVVAVRINSDVASIVDVDLKNNLDQTVKYKLLSIPFYLIEQMPRLLQLNIK